ncbi:uncharacterized protein BDW43DRAFT_313455 [Aspergillus alliaceus]|uniref:uncharacterized protein n=1 Tax=Petromyces alliaceus TaxID=209559 RepID=UPI0012A4A4C3|nr:uncharacterized protein BDW43DRAFT_313455 [Aspergillus alliaceus]KAB8231130.1 hypothetical protein BDW43DRAFT_313455 [Aspergillus alliaceus]
MRTFLDNRRYFRIPENTRKAAQATIEALIRNGLDPDSSDIFKLAEQKYTSNDGSIVDDFPKIFQEALEFVKIVKSLSRVALAADDVPPLYRKEYRSIRNIATERKDRFTRIMLKQGVSETNALAMQDAAQRLDCWNEHFWLTVMEARRSRFTFQQEPRGLEVTPGADRQSKNTNNLTSIFNLEDPVCETCCSITSLAAYFADLLALLRNTRFESPEGSLLGVLAKRRSDLQDLQLTCANSQVLIPYIALVNEVLESYIRQLHETSGEDFPIQVYNTPEGTETLEEYGHSDIPVYLPGTTDESVYNSIISQQMYPFSYFPYEKARDQVTQILGHFKVHTLDVVERFRLDSRLLKDILPNQQQGPDIAAGLRGGVEEVFQRQSAAETIGIQQAEFSIITGETFFPPWFADLLNGLSDANRSVKVLSECPWTAAQLWGYATATDMINKESDTRLSLIKSELMPRSGLGFQEILDLVKTQSFGQDLVIVNRNGTPDFKSSLDDLLLLANASDPPFVDLTAEICFNLQAFLRLKAKLKWATRDIDAAIVCLRAQETQTAPSMYQPQASNFFSISPYVLKSIASILKISSLCGMEPASLLPLWGAIDSYGESSFLHRKFFTPSMGLVSPIFAPPTGDRYFVIEGETVPHSSVDGPLCTCLEWPIEHFPKLLQVAGLEDDGLDLSVHTFTILYRYTTICRMLSVPPEHCEIFFQLFFANPGVDNEEYSNPLRSPAATLATVEKWKRLIDAGWTVESLHRVILGSQESAKSELSVRNGLQITSSILQGAREIRNSFPFLFAQALPSSDNIAECAARIFDAATARQVAAFIEETQVNTVTVPFTTLDELNWIKDESTKWPSKLTLNQSMAGSGLNAVLCLQGLLRQQDRKRLESACTVLDKFKEALQVLFQQSLAAGEIIRARFESSKMSHLIDALLLDEDEPEGQEAETRASDAKATHNRQMIVAEGVTRKRRSLFIRLACPTIISDLMESHIVMTMQTVAQGSNLELLPTLLSNVVRSQGKDQEFAMATLQRLSNSEYAPEVNTMDVYFTPNVTDDFTFIFLKDSGHQPIAPELTINGIKVGFDNNFRTATSVRMSSGQTYRLFSNFPATQLHWATPMSIPASFSHGMLLPVHSVKVAEDITKALGRAVVACETFELTVEELRYFSKADPGVTPMLIIDLNAPTLNMLVEVERYREFTKECRPRSREDRPIELLQWLSSTTEPKREEIVARIAACTGCDRARLLDTLDEKHPEDRFPDNKLIGSLRDFKELLDIHRIMRIDSRLGLAAGIDSQPSISTLFNIAHARYIFTVEEEAEAARSLGARLTPEQRAASDRGLMENQRNALVSYLLQQKQIRDLGIHDADGLFEHFLIDVQMGPQIRTSRIKQAISVVQLFAQRCLLGLEKGVPKSVLNREQWEWRQQYSLWESHVKIFLYPENWLEPGLRDDKSQLFEELETSLMQKSLSLDTFIQGIKTYVHGLSEVSSLKIMACTHELGDRAADIFHLFGRTRTSPYMIFHRTLTVLRPQTAGVFWRPWRKIEMDIPSIEAEWQGESLQISGCHLIPVHSGGRLYLFIPHIIPKTAPGNNQTKVSKSGSSDTSDNAESKAAQPRRFWEITMGWTEFSNHSWTPKRVATGSIALDYTKSKPNELRFEPKFDPDRASSRLVLVVGYPSEKGQYSRIGGFSFCEDQMVAIPTSALGGYRMTNSKGTPVFQKETTNLSPNIEPDTPLAKKNEGPLIWLPKPFVNRNSSTTDSKKAKSISWTLSYEREQAPIGLVFSAQRSDGTSISYFNFPTAQYTADTYWEKQGRSEGMSMVTLDHTFSHDLTRAIAVRSDPLSQLFDTLRTQTLTVPETFGQDNSSLGVVEPDNGTPNKEPTKKKAGIIGGAYHELAQPMALYNWEVGLHSVLLAMDRFFATQQFEAALQVARLVFDPTVDVNVKGASASNPHVQTLSCWKFPPFQEIACNMSQKRGVSLKVSDIAKDSHFNLAIIERRTHGALVHATARGRPEAYMKWIVMKYAEILIAAGDAHFRRSTLESLPLAIQRYVEALHILGPEPPKVPKLGKRKASTFRELKEEDTNLELRLPFSPQAVEGAPQRQEGDRRREKIVCYLRTTYFCVPMNPKFKELRTVVNERLYNVRNSLDIQGRPVTYSLIEPPIDPADLIALSSQGLSMSEALAAVVGEQDSPLPRQRFSHLLQQALELCNELRGLGERLLSAVEKREVEAFSALRARHATAIHNMMLDIKKTQLTEAQEIIDSLQISRSSHVSQLEFYLSLIGEPKATVPSEKDSWVDIAQDIDKVTTDDLRMSPIEKAEMDLTTASGALNTVASGIDGLVAPIFAVPDFQAITAPMGVGTSVGTGGSKIAQGISAASTCIKLAAMICDIKAGQAARKAQLTKQLQERRFQANMHGREIKAIDKQVEIQKTRVKGMEREIELQESEVQEAAQIELWYRTKYTNEQLYSWMEKRLRGLYYQAYTLAMSVARKAESSLAFEQGRRISVLRHGGYWDALHDGLLSADHLYLDLRRLEAASLDADKDSFEITKTISLRQLDPLALLTLRLTGTTTFVLNESLFDRDFPGHYMRRIRSIAVSVPSILGPSSSINATLRLLSHQYRVSSTVSKAADYAAQNRESFRTDNLPISAVAISSGSHDAGVFELSFSGRDYMPFEGAGAVSSWRLDLPKIRQFDYETISDIVLHMQYTALEGGALLSAVASETVQNALQAKDKVGHSDGFWFMWDLKSDFPSEWYQFESKLLTDRKPEGNGIRATMELGNLKDRLPFHSQQQANLKVRNLIFASSSQSLVEELRISDVTTPDKKGTQPKPLGENFTMKSWNELTKMTDLNGWKLTAPSSITDVKNVYMLMRYTYS